jgi:hypothetical protein
MNLQQRTQALLDLVHAHSAERCEALLAPARAQAREIRRAAIGEARQRVRTTIAEARDRLAVEVGAAQARLATDRRLVAQRRASALLDRAWAELRARMKARWSQPAARARWLDTHLQRALDALPRDEASPWRIVLPPATPADERERAQRLLQRHGVAQVIVEDDPRLQAGVLVRAGANTLDATLDGLLADRTTLEGRLLQRVLEANP